MTPSEALTEARRWLQQAEQKAQRLSSGATDYRRDVELAVSLSTAYSALASATVAMDAYSDGYGNR